MRTMKIAASSSALALVLALVSAPVLAVDDPVSGGGSASGGINSDNIGSGTNNSSDPVMDRSSGSGDIETRTQSNSRYDNSQAGIETERELRKKDDSARGGAGASAKTPEEEEAEE